MRKFFVSFAAVLSTFIFAVTPGKASQPVNTLLQFTSGGHVMGFTQNKVYIAGMGHALTEEFIKANTVIPKPLSPDKVIYENLWKGISLTYEVKKIGIAESTYTINPGSDVKNIRIRYNAEVVIQKNGSLTFNHPTSQGSYTMSTPVAWQEKGGTRIPVQVAYTKLSDTTIGFATGPYDMTLPLIIDPIYQWNTFYGSGNQDYGFSIAVDTNGNVYVTGYSYATWGSPLNPHSGNSDIVVLKLDTSGTYQWHTFYGSGGYDEGQGIALDTNGNVYVTGTSSATWGSPLNPHSGNSDIVVLKLDTSGTYQWHTFYGSDSQDEGNGIAVDTSGNVYVTGRNTATWGSPLNPHSGSYDIVVLKLDTSGTYQWHTFYGSDSSDRGNGIAVDTSGNVYVTGTSSATWGTPLNPHSGSSDIVVLKLDTSGTYQWHTFYGSNTSDLDKYDSGYSIALDTSGNVYVTGYSGATWGSPLNPHRGGSPEIMVLKLDGSGTYQWHTFYGSGGEDYGYGITLDTSGNVYVTGRSYYGTWVSPLNPHNGYDDIVVLKLDNSGTYQWHTFYGSSGEDYGYGIALDTSGNVYVTGFSDASWGFPLNPYSGMYDIVVLKLVNAVWPTEGTIGTELTINGSDFGTKKGKVLINGIATKIPKDGWGPGQITCTVSKPPLPIDVAYPVSVMVDKISQIVSDTFTVRGVVLDDLPVRSGIYLEEITVTGKFFGTKKGKVNLEDPVSGKKKKCKVIDWYMDPASGNSTLTFEVPKLPKGFSYGVAYPLKINNKVGTAQTTFTVHSVTP